jgi:hypothetical protein
MFRISFGLALAAACIALAVETVAIADLLKEPAKFDGKAVTVTGKVLGFKQKTSKAGNPYFTMKVAPKEGDAVSVYGRGTSEKEFKDNVTVVVTGKFAKEKKVGAVTFKNEIDVTKSDDDKATKDFGIKVKD